MRNDYLPLPEALNVQYYLPDRSSGLRLKVRPLKEGFSGGDIVVFLEQDIVFRVPVPEEWVAPIILDIPESRLGPNGVYQLRYGVYDPVSEDTYPVSEPVTIIIGPVNT